jgi:hypothetical protein
VCSALPGRKNWGASTASPDEESKGGRRLKRLSPSPALTNVTTPSELLTFMRLNRLAVEASVSPHEAPQAAVVGIAVTDAFELVFDTIESTRKLPNLRRNPRIAFVIGGWVEGDARTVQYEGVADEPRGSERERIRSVYFDVWPDGREREAWPGLAYVRVRPTWIRYSDYNRVPPLIEEFNAQLLRVDGSPSA